MARAPFTSANSVPRQILQSIFARTLGAAPVLASPFHQLGVLSDYAAWKRARLEGGGRPLFAHRERMWQRLLPVLAQKGPLTVLEFGVAWGYATKWWLTRLTDPAIVWYGFDTFTGLPTSWDPGGLSVAAAGSFSAAGNPPPIDDSRVQRHVGEIAGTIKGLDWQELRTRPMFLLLDFDLYAPTAVAMDAAAPHLRTGDLLYFDEAFDAWNERKVIDETLLPRFEVTCLGSTATALAFELSQRRDQGA